MDISGVHTVIPVLVTGIEPAQVLGAEKSLSVAQTCVDWIPVTSTGTRAAIAGLSKQNRPEAPGRLRTIIFKADLCQPAALRKRGRAGPSP